jgi:hypothetical protein
LETTPARVSPGINVRLNIYLFHATVGHGDARGHYRSPESAF